MNDTGNNPSVTAAVVVTTGIVGANFAQVVMDKFGFKDPIARGMATASRFVDIPLFIIHASLVYVTTDECH
jgi:hypothetical protein